MPLRSFLAGRARRANMAQKPAAPIQNSMPPELPPMMQPPGGMNQIMPIDPAMAGGGGKQMLPPMGYGGMNQMKPVDPNMQNKLAIGGGAVGGLNQTPGGAQYGIPETPDMLNATRKKTML